MKLNLVDCASLGIRLPESMAREVDALCPTLPADCRMLRTKAYVADAIQFEPGERAEVSVISSQSHDKSHEVVLIKGMELDAYRKSPIVLWNHNRDLPPVGRCQWIKTHDHDSQLRAKTIYPEDPEGYSDEDIWLPKHVWDLTRTGVLRGKSVGFLPLKPLREPTPDELSAHPDWQGAGVWEQTRLYEYSCVNVGCNDDALVVEINNKSFDPDKLTRLGLVLPKRPALTREEAYLICRGAVKHVKRKADIAKVIEKAVATFKVDPDAIVRKALEMYEARRRA